MSNFILWKGKINGRYLTLFKFESTNTHYYWINTYHPSIIKRQIFYMKRFILEYPIDYTRLRFQGFLK